MSENVFGVNLGGNFPVIDHFERNESYVISMRSHLSSVPGGWERAVLKDIQQVKEGTKKVLSGYPEGGKERISINPSEMRTIYLVEVMAEGEMAAPETSRALATIRSQIGNIRMILAPMRNWKR
jgi:hypothetical protein